MFIQRIYKRRFDIRGKAATKIQSVYRKNKGFRRYLEKLAKKDQGDESDDDIHHHLHHNEVLLKENKTILNKELHNVSTSKFERRKMIDQSSLLRKSQLNMSLLVEMEDDTDKRKILDVLMNNSSMFKGQCIKKLIKVFFKFI